MLNAALKHFNINTHWSFLIKPEVFCYCLILHAAHRILAGEVWSVSQVFGVCGASLKLLLGNCMYMAEIKR